MLGPMLVILDSRVFQQLLSTRYSPLRKEAK